MKSTVIQVKVKATADKMKTTTNKMKWTQSPKSENHTWHHLENETHSLQSENHIWTTKKVKTTND